MEFSDMDVSSLCLGTVNYVTQTSKVDAFEQLNTYKELGGNFLDTAHVYGD